MVEFGLESFGTAYQSVRAVNLGLRSFAMEGVVKKKEMAV